MGGLVSGLFGGDDAADASRDAANIQAQAQREALDYLKETEEIPQQFRREALSVLGGVAGLPGGTGSQQALIDQARLSPLYEAIIGTREQGEEAILRNAAATGGLRSGNVQQALADQAQQLEQSALLQAYNQQLGGLQSLAQTQTNPQQIANQISAIGQTQAQGITAAAQAQQSAAGQGFSTLLGLGSLFL